MKDTIDSLQQLEQLEQIEGRIAMLQSRTETDYKNQSKHLKNFREEIRADIAKLRTETAKPKLRECWVTFDKEFRYVSSASAEFRKDWVHMREVGQEYREVTIDDCRMLYWSLREARERAMGDVGLGIGIIEIEAALRNLGFVRSKT